MPRGFSENQIRLLQEKLISAAFEALSKNGARKTLVGDLAKAVGISTGAFYKFFPSKEALFFAVFERTEEGLKKEFMTRLDASPAVSKAALRDALKHLLLSEKMKPFFLLMQKEERTYLIRGVDPAVIEAHLQNDLSFLNSVIEKLRSQKVQVTENVNLILSFLQALFVLYAARDELGADASQIIDAFIDTFIDTIIA